METLTITRGHTEEAKPQPSARYEDPLDSDEVGDAFVAATRRGLTRLALVAAEAGARFQREGDGNLDPMAWMLAPRRLFGGEAAIDACLSREHFVRALLLHGLSIGLDADAHDIDALLDDEDPADGCAGTFGSELGRAGPKPASAHGKVVELYTATIVHEDGWTALQAFHASCAHDPQEIVSRLARRYGPAAARAAQVRRGFDPTTSFAEALVSPALSDLLMLVEAEPGSSLAEGLDLNLEQRFAA